MMARHRTEEEIADIVDRCVEIERAGGDVLAYLRGEDYISPGGTWFNFQRERLGRSRHEITSGKPKTKRQGERKMGKVNQALVDEFCGLISDGMTKQEALQRIGCDGAKSAAQTFRQIKAFMQEHDAEALALVMDNISAEKTVPVTVPAAPLRIRVTTLETDFAEYRFERGTQELWMNIYTDEHQSDIRLSVEQLTKLMVELPDVLHEFRKGES